MACLRQRAGTGHLAVGIVQIHVHVALREGNGDARLVEPQLDLLKQRGPGAEPVRRRDGSRRDVPTL